MKHEPTGRKLTHQLCAGEIEISCVDKGGFTFGVPPDGTAVECPSCGDRVYVEIHTHEKPQEEYSEKL